MFKLGLKNVFRDSRSYLPYMLVLLLMAFAFTTVLSMATNASLIYRKSGSADLLAVFEDNRACPLASLVPESYGARIQGVPHIEDMTGEVRHMIVYAPRKSLTVAGVEPNKFRDFKAIRINDAEYEDFQTDPRGAIIGMKAHRTFKWKTGESVMFQGMQFNVRGVFELPLSLYDGMVVLHKAYMQELVKKQGYFTAFTVKIDSPENKSTVCKAVEQLFTDHPSGIICRSEAEFWGRTERQLGDFGRNMRALAGSLALLIFGLIANGGAVCLRNRRSQVRTLKMVGFGRGRRFGSLLIEPVVAVLMSAIGGSLIAFLVWIKRPIIGGTAAILPPIAVSPLMVIVSIVALLVIAVISVATMAYKTSEC